MRWGKILRQAGRGDGSHADESWHRHAPVNKCGRNKYSRPTRPRQAYPLPGGADGASPAASSVGGPMRSGGRSVQAVYVQLLRICKHRVLLFLCLLGSLLGQF